MKKRNVLILFSLNCLLSIVLISFGFKTKDSEFLKSVEAEQIVIGNPKSGGGIILRMNGENPEIAMKNAKGKTKIYFDDTGFYLKNDKEKTVGSLVVLSDGGGGLGLADNAGMAAAVIRGGGAPSVGLFGKKSEPVANLAVMENIPHFMVSGDNGSEGILLHGGVRSGMMLLDEGGRLKIFICKDGIYQEKNKEEEKLDDRPKKQEYFSQQEDKQMLFPDGEHVR